MKALYYITQLPEYRAQLERQRDVLDVEAGFTAEDKAELQSIYTMLANKIDTILAREVEVNHPETVSLNAVR